MPRFSVRSLLSRRCSSERRLRCERRRRGTLAERRHETEGTAIADELVAHAEDGADPLEGHRIVDGTRGVRSLERLLDSQEVPLSRVVLGGTEGADCSLRDDPSKTHGDGRAFVVELLTVVSEEEDEEFPQRLCVC